MTIPVLAVDPGKNGAIAWRADGGAINDENMPDTVHEFAARMRQLDPAEVILEKVGFHRIGNNASASAKFARHCGELTGVLAALGIPVREITPHKWQQQLCGALPKNKAQRKKAIRALVEKRIGATVTLRNADAVGLLLWGELQHGTASV